MKNDEYQRKMAEAKANRSPAQAKAAKLIKPIFTGIALAITALVIIMMMSSSDLPKPEAAPATTASTVKSAVDDVEEQKWQAFEGITDCQLAYNIRTDYSVIWDELTQFASQNGIEKQQAVNWKAQTKLDIRLAALADKYPSIYNMNYPNALIAHGMEFAIGQYWRDIYFHANTGNPLDSEQPQLMQDDLNVLKSQCPKEFK